MWFMLGWTLSIVASTIPAQQRPDDRAFFVPLLDRLDAARDAAVLSPSLCNPLTSSPARLCQGLIAERAAELTAVLPDARRAEVILERSVAEMPRSAFAWYGLGMVRLQVAHDTGFSRGGAGMPVGTSYLSGAGTAFARAVEFDNGFVRAQTRLATTPIGRDGAATIAARVRLLRRVRATLPSSTWLAAALLEREAGYVDSAIALERRALASAAVDSGLVSLALARDLHDVARSREGRDVLIRGAGVATTAAREAYRTELGWVASPAELASWDSLVPAARSHWLADFWEKRDVAEGRKSGARLIEHYKRVEYAFKNFQITLPQTGRQKMLSYLSSEYDHTSQVMDMALSDPACGPGLATYAGLDRSIGSHSFHRDYQPTQDQIDDRGVIWIRHGPPTRRGISLTVEAAEVWHYDLPGHALVLQFHETLFNGTVGASTLVSTLVTSSARTREQLCSVEASLCVPGDDVAAIEASRPYRPRAACLVGVVNPIRPEVVQRDHDAGVQQLAEATTTDTYLRNFARLLQPQVQMYGLARTDGARPELVVAYALRASQLVSTHDARGFSYAVDLQLLTGDAGGNRTDVDTVQVARSDSLLKPDQYITGTVTLPLAAGIVRATVVMTQADGRGAMARSDHVVTPDLSGGFAISDLVIGRDGSGVHWRSGTTDVALNPIDQFRMNEPAKIYFQLFGLDVQRQYQVRFEVYRDGVAAAAPPALAITETLVATHRMMEVSRSLDVGNLPAGRYRVQVKVQGVAGAVQAAGWIGVVR
jgi:hypothetical protein